MNKRGIALPMVLILVLCLTLTAATFALLSSNELRIVSRQNISTQAFYIAEGANELCATWMQQNATQAIAQGGVFNPFGTGVIGESYPLSVGTYTTTITPSPLNPTPGATPNINVYTYTMSSTGLVDGVSRTVETDVTLEVETTTFANYSYFTVSESYLIWLWIWSIEIPVWFTTGTFLEGPVHTNGQFNISGNPIFDGPVTSVALTINYMNGGPPNDNPDFRDGITFGVPPIDTTPLTVDDLETAAALAGGQTFTGHTTVVLKTDGTMDVTNAAFPPPHTQNMPLPANGALYVTGGDLSISGTLNGNLTAGSSRDVVIMEDIRYNNDPRTDPTSTDILGLMAKRDVVVDQNAANSNPNNDLEIFASIHAVGQAPAYTNDGSFYVSNYWSKIRGVLTVYGGIVQKYRGPVGTFYSDTGAKASGYDKDYHYDARMATNPPTYVPTTTITTFNRISWQEDIP